MSAALQFELVRCENEDPRTGAVVAFARDVRCRLVRGSSQSDELLAALVRCHEHRSRALERLAALAIAAVPSVDPAYRDGLARAGESVRALFRRGER